MKPNMIFILADDCTYRDLELYGGQAKTPNMNRLAVEGVKFNKVYQSSAMCSPTRHALYTGLHPLKSGAHPNHAKAYSHVKSVVHYLKDLEYKVFLAGKIHIAPESVFPFQYIKEFADPKKKDQPIVDGWRYPEIYKTLKETKTSGPVCMFLCSNEPHGPYTKGDPSKYPPKELKLTPQHLESHRESYSKYLAEITYFDGQVGEIMQMLKELDLEENTLLVVSTEQGSSFPFAKWTCYEMGVASGIVARWPGHIKPDSEINSIVEYVDIVPTFVDVAGGTPSKDLDGRSIKPLLLGEELKPKKFAHSTHTTLAVNGAKGPYAIRSVVDEQYRYVKNLFPENDFSIPSSRSAVAAAKREGPEALERMIKFMKRPAEELYDIVKDPFCLTNLAYNPEHEHVKLTLVRELNRWMQEQGDKGRESELDVIQHIADFKLKKSRTELENIVKRYR